MCHLVRILTLVVFLGSVLASCGDDSSTNPSKEITIFSFTTANNPGLSANVVATINSSTINAVVPNGTDLSALVATFEATGNVTINGTAQESGVTANDFGQPLTYQVTATDKSTRNYTVTVTAASSIAKEITSFAFLAADSTSLDADVTATIQGTSIDATVPFGTDVTALVANFATTGESVAVAGTVQVSGTTANDFTNIVTYTVSAADGSTKDYTVTVVIASNTAKEITAYAFLSVNNAGLEADVTATITGDDITATVPFGTDVTALVATFSTTGQTVEVGATAQVSDTTANDFTNAVVYRVTAADASTRDYTVTVTIAASDAKELTAFSFRSVNNAGLAADVIATINGTDIEATVPFGTDATALVATFSTTGQTVSIGGTAQVSDVTANDFTNSVTYTVTAADNSTKDFTVIVTVAPNDAKDITAFAFLSVDNPGLTDDVIATITGTIIEATVPSGTDVTALVATFSTSGQSVSVGATTQVSGITANDFTNSVSYSVSAADNSTQIYAVDVTIAL